MSAKKGFSKMSLQAFEEESFSGDIVYQQLLLQILTSLFFISFEPNNLFLLASKEPFY